ncbi:nuclear GTPase SLIP-GC isoform X2 [Carettochelys insculpta]|uniref:nuclear GTPase SLIP-GC isoform X2 n=1 Tax=Carettochelys insculpta TaxID=44489 RepID=UPI003EBCB2E9
MASSSSRLSGGDREDANESPGKKKKLDKYRAFNLEEQQRLRTYESTESRTRKVVHTAYKKLTTSLPQENMSNEIKYLTSRLSTLKEKASLDPIYIGLFGSTGAGKSSLLNAIINQQFFLPVSGSRICTSCIVQVSSSQGGNYEAKIHLLSLQEWQEELKNLVELVGRPEEEEEGEEDTGEAVRKLRTLYGRHAETRSHEDLLRMKLLVTIPSSKYILLRGARAKELADILDPYVRCQDEKEEEEEEEEQGLDDEKAKMRLWPLIKYVEVTIPKSDVIPEGVVFVDIPGTGDYNSKRDEMWKESINKCSVIWIVSDIERVVGNKTDELLLAESIKAYQGGMCSDLALVVTKSDKLHLKEYLSERKVKNKPIETKHEAILERNAAVKVEKSQGMKSKLRRRLPSDSQVLHKTELVYTVSAKEYWQEKHLTKEETEIPKLREYIRSIYLKERKQLLMDYVTEAFVIVLLAENFNSPRDMVRSTNQGFHKTLKAVCQKNGVYASRTFTRIDVNSTLAQPIYNNIDPMFCIIFRPLKGTRASLKPCLEMFKDSIQGKIQEVGKKNAGTNNNCKLKFLIQETNIILSTLEKEILKKKMDIYQSLPLSIQSNLQPYYKEAAQVKGTGSLQKMQNILRENIEKETDNGMFEEAKQKMTLQLQELKEYIVGKLKKDISTMLKLALSHREELPETLPDFQNEYKEIEQIHGKLQRM